MSIERDEILVRLLLGVRDGSMQALDLLTGRGGQGDKMACGKATGIMQAQVAMLDAVLAPPKPQPSPTSPEPDKLLNDPPLCNSTSAPA